MGRTLPTIIQIIRFEEEQFQGYRRALRQEDRELFDALWRFARHYAVSAQMANRPIAFEGLLINMILGVLKEVRSHRCERRLAIEGKNITHDPDQRMDI